MKLKPIRDLRDKAPFRPFNIHLNDGRVLPVATPDYLFIFPNSEELVVAFEGGGFEILDATEVATARRGRVKVKAP